ncbi:FKBP-type peptidyl-prolyl cis-trans isomerase [Lishizhenia tianjinensis]|uniref:peptidylprolyl isomerase n=1 Tax=Lishizhenia tianjinensis TaxID=477690 RepID=A0A1I6YZR8_9FLAO|nr:FKBP-type peptidyl-prolyl cis-trans isomerase [Lishizhenia tianjinensis]SFT55903.1 FKBP-type peptidyl-prolyl cis-trans isomerase [Lishizhenia tianjinensis]
MKKIFFGALTLALVACGEKSSTGNYDDLTLNSIEEKISFSIGADMASNFKNFPDTIFKQLDFEQLEASYVAGYANFSDEQKSECEQIMQQVVKQDLSIDTSAFSMGDLSACYGNYLGEATRLMLETKDAENVFDIEIARKGFARSLVNTDTSLISEEERIQIVENFYNDLTKKSAAKLMQDAKAKAGVTVISEDVILEEVSKGNGETLVPNYEYKMVLVMQNTFGDTMLATIKDYGMNDDINSQVLQFQDRRLVEGWRDAMAQMEVGGEYKVYCSTDKAFGEEGLRNPRNGSFIFQPYEALTITTKVVAQNEIGAVAKQKGEDLIAATLKRPNTKKYPEGYVIETLKKGTGKTVPAGADVKAHYILYDADMNELQNSYKMSLSTGGEPLAFNLNGVVKGWTLGLQNMQIGGKYRLYIPYDLGYGTQGNDLVPPYETLVFEMEILEIGEAGEFVQPRSPMMGGM